MNKFFFLTKIVFSKDDFDPFKKKFKKKIVSWKDDFPLKKINNFFNIYYKL